jgi:DNA polymerase-3 subunit epsilon
MWDEYIILNIETTGLSPHSGGEICKVEALTIKNEFITEYFSSFISINNLMPTAVSSLIEISNKQLKDAPSSIEVLSKLHYLIGSKVVISHNASFNKLFLDASFEALGIQSNSKYFCTIKFAKAIFANEAIAGTMDSILQKLRIDERIALEKYCYFLNQHNYVDGDHIKRSTMRDVILIFATFQELTRLMPSEFDFKEHFF